VKQQLTGAKTNIDKARDLVESLAEQVRAHLRDIAELVEADEDGDADSPEASQRSLIS
jgi:septation ring formation regulator EzrA